MKAWINHFALNFGSALACLFYALIPPQWTGHTRDELESLGRDNNPWSAFVCGLGLSGREQEPSLAVGSLTKTVVNVRTNQDEEDVWLEVSK